MRWELCRRTHDRLRHIVGALGFSHVDPSRIFCVRGYGSTSEAWARIWGLPSLWQQVLEIGPAYVVEVIEPEFGRLPEDEQDRILIHELLHIPRTFSGAIRPHRTPTFRINRRTVERFYQQYLSATAGSPARVREAERLRAAHPAGGLRAGHHETKAGKAMAAISPRSPATPGRAGAAIRTARGRSSRAAGTSSVPGRRRSPD
ncbi:MAG TPA: putative metallopeptidase [bacterium]|nr:putative metallopeptidase [bacterium]